MTLNHTNHLSSVGVCACTYWGCDEVLWKDLENNINTDGLSYSKHPHSTITFIIATILILFIILITMFYCGRKVQIWITGTLTHKHPSDLITLTHLPTKHTNTENALYLYANSLEHHADTHRLPRMDKDQICMDKFLGSGAFGKVYEGEVTVDQNKFKVAIKTLHKMASDVERGELLREAFLMHKFNHDKILRLWGVVVEDGDSGNDGGELFLVIELMPFGDLLTFLRKDKMIPSLHLEDLYAIAQDVCEGCQYLQEMRFVHRDLAARNCLVGKEDGRLVVKIGDFGLARDVYSNHCYRKVGEGLLPVRWMAPESLTDGIFTTYSDIWSYGVVVWEVFSHGQQPYPARSNLEVLNLVKNGGRLQRPKICSPALYDVMETCWAYTPMQRPLFRAINATLIHLRSSYKDAQDYQNQTAYRDNLHQENTDYSYPNDSTDLIHNDLSSTQTYIEAASYHTCSKAL